MKTQLAFACLAMFIAHHVMLGCVPQAVNQRNEPTAFTFAGVKYFHRFTKADQHEYTPGRQEDLKRWTDMVTINYYRQAKDGEALAVAANSVLENYKANKGMVVKTDSVPKTRDRAAEHLIVVLFPRPEFIEVAFARFRMHDGVGTSVIYSHRIYGNKSGNEMSEWLETNGTVTGQNLMTWNAMPKLPASR
jgi:hypothetical protein